MSEMAKTARAALKAKASRMAHGDPHARVDASSWTPSEPLNAEAKTGARPVSRRAYKTGGAAVAGKAAAQHAGRKPRKTGGTVASYAADSTKEANPSAHVGAYKRGGKARAAGGAARRYVGSEEVTADDAPEVLGVARPKTGTVRVEGGKIAKNNPVIIAARKADEPEARKVPSASEREKSYKAHREKNPLPARKLGLIDRALNKAEGHKKGGRTGKMFGGGMGSGAPPMAPGTMQGMGGGLPPGLSAGPAMAGAVQPPAGPVGDMSQGGFKRGGRTKGKTNINIIISTGKGQGQQPQPPMMPPPPGGGAPVPVPAPHPAMPPAGAAPPPAPPPMPRKSGGRAAARTSGYKSLEAGAGSGLGRLHKAHSAK